MTADRDLAALLALMRRLRDPVDGCPWDRKQDWRSLLPHTLGEVYELADAIERDDVDAVRDELGDYLFQAVFYAQVAAEQGRFDFGDVTAGIVAKLLERHPHVFPDGTLASRRAPGDEPDTQAIRQTWERIKADDRARRALTSVLDDVPAALPALARAEKLQKRAATVGFDWRQADGVLAKLREELAELEAAVASGDAAHCDEELGDLLFTCVNLARHLELDAESSLRGAARKFERRFRLLERDLAARGRDPRDCDEATLEAAWERAKRAPATD